MSFALASDLHLEFLQPNVKVPEDMLPDPSAAHLLVLAGDVCGATQTNYKKRLLEATSQFDMVLYVPGNHEYYDGALSEPMAALDRKMEAVCFSTPNVVFMQKRGVIIRDTIYLGCTMWTNPSPAFWENPPVNDYNMICGRRRGQAVTPKELAAVHKDHAAWLRSEIRKAKRMTGVHQAVVITHHCPDISLARGCRHRRADTRPWYYSTDLKDLVEDPFIRVWCHGHTHESSLDRMPSGVTFATNALGYATEETGFNPRAVFTL
jgi:hypothetical protein